MINVEEKINSIAEEIKVALIKSGIWECVEVKCDQYSGTTEKFITVNLHEEDTVFVVSIQYAENLTLEEYLDLINAKQATDCEVYDKTYRSLRMEEI